MPTTTILRHTEEVQSYDDGSTPLSVTLNETHITIRQSGDFITFDFAAAYNLARLLKKLARIGEALHNADDA